MFACLKWKHEGGHSSITGWGLLCWGSDCAPWLVLLGWEVTVAAAFWLGNRAEQGLPSLRWGHCLRESHWLGEDVHFLSFWHFYELYLWMEERGTFSIRARFLDLVFTNEKTISYLCRSEILYDYLILISEITVNVMSGRRGSGEERLLYPNDSCWD